MPVILLMPWFSLAEATHFSDFDLFPFERGRVPAGLNLTFSLDLDDLVGRFVESGSRAIGSATLIKLNGRELAFEPSQEERELIGVLSEVLAVGGLSYREFFSSGTLYSNKQTFQIHLAPVGARIVNIRSRRRDGYSENLIPETEFRAQKPEEVIGCSQHRLDSPLISALLRAKDSSSRWQRLLEAIVCFNLANTDSSTMWAGSEAILLVSAFERLLDRYAKEHELRRAFSELVVPSSETSLALCSRLTEARNGQFRQCRSIREVWIVDFHRLRGELAHGKVRPGYQPLWSLPEHLLFASYIFPLALKSFLSGEGSYELTGSDRFKLDSFEARLSLSASSLSGSEDGDAGSAWIRAPLEQYFRRSDRCLILGPDTSASVKRGTE